MIKYLDFKSKKHFSNTQIIPAMLEAGLYNQAMKLKSCGAYTLNVAVCTNCYTPHFAGSTSCKDKFCPVCQKKRSLLWLTKLIPICTDLLERGYHLNMLTYTVRTNKDMSLTQCLDMLNNGYRYMTNGHRTYKKQFNDLIIGGVRSLEVKVGEDKTTGESTNIWHPHFHILVCTRNNMSYREMHKLLYSMWNDCLNTVCGTQDKDLGGVHIDSIKARDQQSLLDALCEVFKYMTKFDWQGEKVYELVTTLHKVRMQNSFGNLKELIKESDIERDMNKNYLDIEKNFCDVCGGSEFATVYMDADCHIHLHDFKNKYSDINQDDLILKDYKEKEDEQ